MSDYFTIRLSITVMFIFAALVFTVVCSKRRDLISWLFAYIAGSISEIFRLISQEDYDVPYLIGLVFSTLTLLLIIFAVSREYYQTFYQSLKTQAPSTVLLLIMQQFVSISLQVIIGILLFIALFLILRIYLKKKTPTHAFLFFILICGILNLVAIALRDVGISGAEEFYLFSSIVMGTIMLLTGIVALIEERLVKSEKKHRLAYNRAEFYKDLFVHDINNILQNLQFSLEIISQNIKIYENKENLDELINIAKGQVIRGAELGLNVKKLSDLEIGAIKNEAIELFNILECVISETKKKFPEEEIEIEIESITNKIFVFANILLKDIFRIILNNAIKYNESPVKEILIRISKETRDFGSNIKLEFIDNGVGIPDAMKNDILQPVYKNIKDFKRIGLGLLLVNEVINSFSGKIWVEDKVIGDYTKGSNIVLLIPEAYGILDVER
ncbi:MAG: sensor histidine kinase [Candidatus Hermodarchaeota archaeon]